MQALRIDLDLLGILHKGGCGDRLVAPLGVVHWPGIWDPELLGKKWTQGGSMKWFQSSLAPSLLITAAHGCLSAMYLLADRLSMLATWLPAGCKAFSRHLPVCLDTRYPQDSKIGVLEPQTPHLHVFTLVSVGAAAAAAVVAAPATTAGVATLRLGAEQHEC
jgi:hypothetical protein